MLPQRKMGFWSLTSLVAGSQIGSGIFLLPASLAIYGTAGLTSWFITAIGAMLLALVFARLSAKIPKTGGPHTFIESAFGRKAGFFSAWTYWVISWMSTPMVIISIVSYLTPLFGNFEPMTSLFIEIAILLSVTLLNLKGCTTAGRAEFIFTTLKLFPLLIVPLGGIFFINMDHFTPFNPTENSIFSTINAAALLTLWGFIGVESATTPAESVLNAKKTIPRALIIGTLIVSIVYILSSFVIMGIIPPALLSQSKAPFADAAAIIFGGSWHLFISVAASVVCLGTLNAWVLTSGQIALGAAEDGHLPSFFKRKNKNGAPYYGLLISSLGIIPILIFTLNENLISQINMIIDISVTAFLFVYALSVLSYLKLFWRKEHSQRINTLGIVIGVASLIFCAWALWASGIKMVGLALLIPLSGLPLRLIMRKMSASSLTLISQENA